MSSTNKNIVQIGLINVLFLISGIACSPTNQAQPTINLASPDATMTPDEVSIGWEVPNEIAPFRFKFVVTRVYTLIQFQKYYKKATLLSSANEHEETHDSSAPTLDYVQPDKEEIFATLYTQYMMIWKVIFYRSCSIITYSRTSTQTSDTCALLYPYISKVVSEIPTQKIYDMAPFTYTGRKSGFSIGEIVSKLESIRTKIIEFGNVKNSYFIEKTPPSDMVENHGTEEKGKPEKISEIHKKLWVKMWNYFGRDSLDLHNYFNDAFNFKDPAEDLRELVPQEDDMIVYLINLEEMPELKSESSNKNPKKRMNTVIFHLLQHQLHDVNFQHYYENDYKLPFELLSVENADSDMVAVF